MKTLTEHIHHVKGQPHHVRRQVTFAVVGGTTIVIALVWFGTKLALGSFALPNTSFADATGKSQLETVPHTSSTGLAGAAAALDAGTPAHIEIVDTASSTKPAPKAEQTTIPF